MNKFFNEILQSGHYNVLIYNSAMGKGKVLKLILGLFAVFFVTLSCFADEHKILVLPDNIQFDSTNYYIFPDSSTMFATDTINEIKKNGRIKTVSMTEVRDSLRKNTSLNILTKKALKEFKYNYNIPFVDFKAIAHNFSADKVLVISSQTDVQNYAIRRSIWDMLNFPGMPVVNPAYRVATYVALIDVDKEQIIWQNTYYKILSSWQGRILAQNFAPATEQLEKIKFYSTYMLSPQIASTVEARILPPLEPLAPDPGIVNVTNTQQTMPLQDDIEFKTKIFIPSRDKNKKYGENINEL